MKLPTIAIFGLVTVAVTSLAHAQAVQLPTIHVTGVSTTVMVPDGGTMLIGGGTNYSSGSISRGVPGLSNIPGLGRGFGNRAFGSSVNTGVFSVSAQIHDLREMDEALLAEAAAHREGGAATTRLSAADAKADFISRHVERRVDDRTRLVAEPKPKTPSVEEIRAQNALALEKQNAEAQSLLEQGRQAEVAGKPGVAKIFYNMAARRATGELQTELRNRLAALASGTDKAGHLAVGR